MDENEDNAIEYAFDLINNFKENGGLKDVEDITELIVSTAVHLGKSDDFIDKIKNYKAGK